MTYTQAEAEFKAAVQHLRKQDGARPKEIPQGTLMVTSLAHFRSDYTIVHIPDGDFLAAQERLYSNINLLRMGCSGRSAVTLEEPSDTTKDRFKSTYLLSDGSPPVGAFRAKVNSRTHTRTYSHTVTTLSLSVPEASTAPPSASHQLSGISLSHPNTSQTGVLLTQGGLRHPHFASYVLEFVKLLQAALAICGMFPLSPPHLPGPTFDGLLCDVTVDGLRRWVTEIGESLIGFESTERIADPSVVAALLSFVLSTRNKLASSVQSVPKDPFLHPYEFLCVLSSYVHSQPVTNNVSTPMLPALIASQLPGQPGHSFPGHGFGNGSATSSATSPVVPNLPFVTPSASNLPLSSTPVVYPHSISSPTTIHVSPLIPIPITYLTLALHTSLLSQHDAKLRDSRKVHRALLSKLELTSDSEATDDERKGLGGRVMGLVGRVSVSGLGGAGPGTVGAPTADLGILVRGVVSGREREREKGREREKERERERDKDRQIRDGESLKERVDGAEEERIGGSLRMLWSGKVEALVRLRERAEGMGWVHRERERERERVWDKEGDRGWEKDKDRLMLSDVDDAVQKNMGEDELAFGGVWSGKVQKKLDMWARINRSKKSVDLLPPIKSVGRMSSVAIPLSAQSSSSGHVYPASELKGLGVPAVVLSHDNGEEDELLSSGQVSPISVSRTHNPLILRPSNDVSSADLPDAGKDKPLDESLAIRELVRDGEMGEMGRGGERGGSRGEMWWRGQVLEDDIMKKGKQVDRQEVGRMLSHRRHTFNDFHSVRDVPVLRTDRMCMDVELCGQILVMRRREAHLEGVVKCLEHLTTVLAHNSTSLRAAYTAHKPMVEALTSRSSPSIHYQSHTHLGESTTSPVTLSPTSPTPLISPTLPTSPHYTSHSHSPPGLTPLMAALHALPVPPPVPALQYEAAQLRVDDMWASAREARRKVVQDLVREE
ncbi:hypothetical protein BS17DRAFT_881442 [Gyrodon lividus]|nr:hypothetical protein BS17DRAFT_881442 [Gyrodon lividus]